MIEKKRTELEMGTEKLDVCGEVGKSFELFALASATPPLSQNHCRVPTSKLLIGRAISDESQQQLPTAGCQACFGEQNYPLQAPQTNSLATPLLALKALQRPISLFLEYPGIQTPGVLLLDEASGRHVNHQARTRSCCRRSSTSSSFCTSTNPIPKTEGHYQQRTLSCLSPSQIQVANIALYKACESALSSASAYKHSSTESWNSTIINTTLQSLVKETSTTNSQPQYKFAVNSTIIQHVPASSETISEKRGMHSATAAYWNAEKDGMWNFKYDAAEPKGLDVVVQVIWISI